MFTFFSHGKGTFNGFELYLHKPVPKLRYPAIAALMYQYQNIFIFAKTAHSVSDPTEECEVFFGFCSQLHCFEIYSTTMNSHCRTMAQSPAAQSCDKTREAANCWQRAVSGKFTYQHLAKSSQELRHGKCET